MIFNLARFVPIDAAASSLPRMAASSRPVVPWRIASTTAEQAMSKTNARTKKAFPLVKLSEPSWGRGMLTPESPFPDQGNWKPTLSARSPKASVANANASPPRRSAGIATTTPTTAATAPPATIPRRTEIPKWLTSCAQVNAPMPAKAAWQSEIWPLIPVSNTMDRKMIE